MTIKRIIFADPSGVAVKFSQGLNEGLTDPLDIAREISEIERNRNTQAIRHRSRPKQVASADGTWPVPECVECDARIPVARLKAVGAITCVFCESKKEQRNKLYAN